jgi:hypothetical protein
MLRTVNATRYVLPLREGGSLPAIVEADDLGLYVVKFRGAGQGPLALAAELIAGEIGRALGLNVPELVFVNLDAALGRNEPDAEIRELIKKSGGLNVGLDYLPGSTMFDPAARDMAAHDLASLAVWFDAFTLNVDRTPRNANLLVWHRKLYFIDHGAALFFHHDWETRRRKIESPFVESAQHILLPWATEIEQAARLAHERLSEAAIEQIVAQVPGEWLAPLTLDGSQNGGVDEIRAGYAEFFGARLASSPIFEQEAIRAHARVV